MTETDPQEGEDLSLILHELRRVTKLRAELDKQRDALNQRALPLLEPLGGASTIVDPTTGEQLVVSTVAAETLEVDAGELLAALIEQYDGDEEIAEAVWKDVLKPPVVDTKDDGLLHQAVKTGRITDATIAKVARFKAKKPYVGFFKPGG